VLGAYDAALAKALPLPGYSYKLLQKKLHEAWASVQAEQNSVPPKK
jgi:hypothetical protein